MGARYAEIADLYRHGVPRGSLVSRARVIASVSPSSDTLTLDGHGLEDDLPVFVSADPGATLPSPLAANTRYFAKTIELATGVADDTRFQLAATAGGAAIDLTTAGSGVLRLTVPLVEAALEVLEYPSRWVDSVASAHVVPFTAPYPVWVTAVVAKRAAASLARSLGLANMAAIIDEAREVTADALRMGRSGLDLRDPDATAVTNVARGASPSTTASTRWAPLGDDL